jgi:hypothetical protein
MLGFGSAKRGDSHGRGPDLLIPQHCTDPKAKDFVNDDPDWTKLHKIKHQLREYYSTPIIHQVNTLTFSSTLLPDSKDILYVAPSQSNSE